jgi:serine/threonine protein kinase
MDVFCSSCGLANRDTAKFCNRCGNSLPKTNPMAQSAVPQSTSPSGSTSAPSYGLTGMLSTMSVLRNRYRILEKRAQGGMAAVYRAADMHLAGKMWAVKEMSDAVVTNPLDRQQAVAAFQQEAQMLANLSHANLPKVTDYFSEDGREYLVMEYIDGQTLDEMLTACGNRPFSEEQALGWAFQLCDVLEYLHHQGIIFRDLKPSNIMIDRNGSVRLIDFGIARVFKVGKASDTTAFGTPGYAPPELYSGSQSDVRSDIYSLGATLHTLLTGFDPNQAPFNLPPMRQFNPAVSQETERAVTTALAYKADQRWPNIGAMRSSLAASPAAKTFAADKNPTQPQRSKPITTRLLLAMSTMTNQQLAFLVAGLVVTFSVLTVVLGPFIQQKLPFVWRTVPLYYAAGVGAWTASHRKGAAGITQALVSLAVMVAGGSFYPNNLIGLLAGAAVLEGWIALAKYRRWDALWMMSAALVAYTVQSLTIFWLLPEPTRLVGLIGAGAVGLLGWFLGDLFWQGRQMRKPPMA